MTVMELKALPLGFRFHPTDEELVRHYLKGKITGQIKNEVEVIPEIDVCKCEPWDLPDKALIRSEDPEWFFFAPKDRKYPNGSRSNRATEAGYWKATGKDRVIKSKGEKKKQHMIGMKKTLVFHRGRAPKGERTGWIMHEYRTTEPEFESGEQGGYVLYRLFQKQVEKTERSIPEEMDRSGYSPTPSRSTPDNMEANEEAITLINKESPESGLHGCPIELPCTIETLGAPVTRWLADRNGNPGTDEANDVGMPFHRGVDESPKQADLSVGSLAHLIDSQTKNLGSHEFATVSAPMLPDDHLDNLLLHLTHNSVEDFLNETIADPDELSSTACKVQYDSDNGIMQGDLLYDDPNWFGNFLSDDTNPQPSGLYENAPLLPYGTNPDVLSMDSGDESLQDLFNSMDDSSWQNDVWSNGFGFNPMHQQLQSTVHPNYIFSQQGIARRRLRLLDSLSDVNVESRESMTRDEHEDEESDIVTSKYRSESVESSADVDESESTGVTIMSRRRALTKSVPSDRDDAESTGITIMGRRSAPSSNAPSDEADAEATGINIVSRRTAPSSSTDNSFTTEQGTAVRRLRLQSNLDAGSCSSVDGLSSCIIEHGSENEGLEAEIDEHVDTNFLDDVGFAGNSHADEHMYMPDHEANSLTRLRKTAEKSDKENKQECGPQSHVRAPRKRGGFAARMILPVLSVALLVLVSVGVYGWA
ncbi:protein NTM1-like 9 isoform X3 [Hordeum vulgare subsp. vulgare]|uniref:protein NTM1-like 9 isoform X3 n=1 Tax=Hordeum vulgare subsp. vulgare TaxID=112509 RepID=UPI001D1A3BF5|nr:protein NTM1-like 9 isoform X3 [Hordeum vulgare subsp. vulgare]